VKKKATKKPLPPPIQEQATQGEIELRVSKVMALIAKGLTRREIHAYVPQKTDWQVGTRQLDEYIARANEQFKLDSAIDRARERGISQSRFELLYTMAVKVQDVKAATAAEWKRCELLGLPEPKELRIIESVDTKLLNQLAEMLHKQGRNPNDLLTALLEEIAASDGSERLQ